HRPRHATRGGSVHATDSPGRRRSAPATSRRAGQRGAVPRRRPAGRPRGARRAGLRDRAVRHRRGVRTPPRPDRRRPDRRGRAPPLSLVTDDGLAALAETVTPQGVVAVCRHLDVALSEALTRRPHLVAVLAGVRDPGNAGTVLRTADAAGAGAVVFAGETVDPYNRKAVRASAGRLLPV